MELIDITNSFNKEQQQQKSKLFDDIEEEEEDDEYDSYKHEIDCYKENLLEFDNWNTLSIGMATTESSHQEQVQAAADDDVYSITSTDTEIYDKICNIVKSTNDNRILNDRRLIVNLNNLQLYSLQQQQQQQSYFDTIQNDVKLYMRKIVVSWMLEVCEEEKCDRLVFPLSVYILDRFLFVHRITRNVFQLLACACLFLSSKLCNVVPISAERLVLFSDNSITIDNLIDMEIMVLIELNWDIISVTPIEYIEYLLNKMSIKLKESGEKLSIDMKKVSNHCKTLVLLCIIESECLTKLSSIIASACLLSAFEGIYKQHDVSIVRDLIVNEATLNINEVMKYKDYVDGLYASAASTPQ